jgi:general stress protein 26
VIRDRALIRSMWTAAAKPWFPEGPEAEDLALLEVRPTHAEYWDGPSNMVSRALAMAASIAAGRPIGLGEHGEIDLTAPAHP